MVIILMLLAEGAGSGLADHLSRPDSGGLSSLVVQHGFVRRVSDIDVLVDRFL